MKERDKERRLDLRLCLTFTRHCPACDICSVVVVARVVGRENFLHARTRKSSGFFWRARHTGVCVYTKVFGFFVGERSEFEEAKSRDEVVAYFVFLWK